VHKESLNQLQPHLSEGARAASHPDIVERENSIDAAEQRHRGMRDVDVNPRE
jgi:hypothetical protein